MYPSPWTARAKLTGVDPGCAVDIPAALYSLSFAPNPGFSKLFSSQPEVLSYLKKVADQYGVHTHMVYNTEWEGASWDEQTKRWSVTLRHLPSNESFLHECRILISAVGALVNPTPFHVPGTSLFRGPIIHTARWQDVDLQDGRIIVVGNGGRARRPQSKIHVFILRSFSSAVDSRHCSGG